MAASTPPDYEIRPSHPHRRLVRDSGWMARRLAPIRGLIEVDVTDARGALRDHRERTGESISFTAFITACTGAAVAADRSVHAMLDWRNRPVVFRDVDVMITIDSQDFSIPILHIIRAADRRSVVDIHHEVRDAQADPARSHTRSRARSLTSLPAFIRHLIYRITGMNPRWMRHYVGTVGLTSIGMFGGGSGWGIGNPTHSVSVIVGGIARRPVMEAGTIAEREFLQLTVEFNHDVVDGAPAARFTAELRRRIEAGYGLDVLADLYQPEPVRRGST